MQGSTSTTKSSGTAKSPRRLVATVATVVAAASLAAGPGVASASASPNPNCEWCGMNHNEVMATTARR
jgi:hypothetical protein